MFAVFFDIGKSSLKPGTREKGIVLAYPGLDIEVGGYTDNVGSDTFTQNLSGQRADSVRDYLVQQRVATNPVTAKGFGNMTQLATRSQ